MINCEQQRIALSIQPEKKSWGTGLELGLEGKRGFRMAKMWSMYYVKENTTQNRVQMSVAYA